MYAMLRLPQFAAVLLLATPCVGAETPFTDPIPPAVVGRPLYRVQPATPVQPSRPRPVTTRPYAAPPVASKPVASKPAASRAGTSRSVASKPASTRSAATRPDRTRQATAVGKAAAPVPSPVPPPALAAAAPAAVLGNAADARPAKPAVDDRPDPRAKVANDVGQGSRFARKPLDPGAYISSKYQALVRQYYEAHPVSTKGAKWKIGEPVPRKASVSGVPDDLRARLPVVPPGHQYVQVNGEVVLLAVQSRMVVDGVARTVH